MSPSNPDRPKPIALGAAGRRITVDGVELAYDDDGNGPPVLCLHAIGHSAVDFTRLRARLGDRHRVLALDWPGQGNSGSDHEPASARRYTEILRLFVDALGIDRLVLLGNSIGGAAALRYAAGHPERAHAVIAENPGGLAPTDDRAARVALAGMARFFEAGARRARWFPAAFRAYYRLCVLPGARVAEHRSRITAAAYEVAPVLAQAWRSFAEPDADTRALAPRTTCPILFAWAERDRFVALRYSQPAIAAFPNAKVQRFAATHAAHLETPDEFEAAVESFLDEVGWRSPMAATEPRRASVP